MNDNRRRPDADRIRELSAAGLTPVEIAIRQRWHPDTIRKILYRQQVNPPRREKPTGERTKAQELDRVAAKMRAKYGPRTARLQEGAAYARQFRWGKCG